MADSAVAVTAGTGTNIDTRTEGTNGHHRQVVVLGDPATNVGVAPVDATAGLKVDLGADNDVTVAGVSTAAKQDTIIGHVDGIETSLTSIDGKITAVNTGAVVVSSSALPSGASTAAKQPALGTAGTASADVITVQGIASMTALKVDGSAVTQPVSGTVAVTNAGITTIAGAVSGTEMQVDVLTMPTTTVTATDLDIRPLVNTDVVTAELSAVDNAVLDTIAAKDFATQTTLAAINAKLVTGTVIGDVNLGATDNAVLDTIATHTGNAATSLGTLDNAISGSEMQVDVVGALPAGTNAIGKLAANSGVDIGDVDVTSISAGTNLIGDVGIKPRTTGGLTTYHLVSGASTNATNIKASAGQIFGWYIYNSNASARKVVFHNTAGTPTAGASVYFSLVIPPSAGANVFSDIGIPFSTGIAITTVTGLADSDNTGVAANDLIINIFYS